MKKDLKSAFILLLIATAGVGIFAAVYWQPAGKTPDALSLSVTDKAIQAECGGHTAVLDGQEAALGSARLEQLSEAAVKSPTETFPSWLSGMARRPPQPPRCWQPMGTASARGPSPPSGLNTPSLPANARRIRSGYWTACASPSIRSASRGQSPFPPTGSGFPSRQSGQPPAGSCSPTARIRPFPPCRRTGMLPAFMCSISAQRFSISPVAPARGK